MTRNANNKRGRTPEATSDRQFSPRRDDTTAIAARADAADVQTLGEFMLFFDGCTDRSGRSDWLVRIYDAASGEETLLAPPERDRWADWIMQRVRLPAAVKLTVSATAHALAADSSGNPGKRRAASRKDPARIEVLDVRYAQGVPDTHPRTEICFRLSGADAESLTNARVQYRIETYALDLEKRAPALLAATEGHLKPQIFEYTDHQALTLPDLGRYELHSLVLLLPPADQIACHRGPVLNVVP
jgi:hypothetical protein